MVGCDVHLRERSCTCAQVIIACSSDDHLLHCFVHAWETCRMHVTIEVVTVSRCARLICMRPFPVGMSFTIVKAVLFIRSCHMTITVTLRIQGVPGAPHSFDSEKSCNDVLVA